MPKTRDIQSRIATALEADPRLAAFPVFLDDARSESQIQAALANPGAAIVVRMPFKATAVSGSRNRVKLRWETPVLIAWNPEQNAALTWPTVSDAIDAIVGAVLAIPEGNGETRFELPPDAINSATDDPGLMLFAIVFSKENVH